MWRKENDGVLKNSEKAVIVYAWNSDLEASRDVNQNQRNAIGMVLRWLENWRMRVGCEAERECCVRFWREQVLVKERESQRSLT